MLLYLYLFWFRLLYLWLGVVWVVVIPLYWFNLLLLICLLCCVITFCFVLDCYGDLFGCLFMFIYLLSVFFCLGLWFVMLTVCDFLAWLF